MHAYNDNASALLAVGLGAAKTGNLQAAAEAEAALRGQRERTVASAANTARGRSRSWKGSRRGDRHREKATRGRERLLKEATALESLDAPSGPADPSNRHSSHAASGSSTSGVRRSGGAVRAGALADAEACAVGAWPGARDRPTGPTSAR
jgi:hypothetical protein